MQNTHPSPPNGGSPIPDFAPVPRKQRYDGWTPDRQRAFICALAELGNVKAACERINMSAVGAYHLRRQPGAEGFRAAWDAALDFGVQRLADIAMDRATEGVPVPVFYKGEQVGERRAYNDRLLMFVLKHHMPDRYGAAPRLPDGTKHPATRAREAAGSEPEDIEVVRARIEAKLDRLMEKAEREMAAEKAIKARETYERLNADPAKRTAWELLNDKPLESMLEAGEEQSG